MKEILLEDDSTFSVVLNDERQDERLINFLTDSVVVYDDLQTVFAVPE